MVAVGRVDLPDAGQAVYDCSVEKSVGPGGYGWCPYAEGTGTSEWSAATSPTEKSVSFRAQSPADVRAGLAFQFEPSGTFHDLSSYFWVNVAVNITEGDSFELFLGQGPTLGCSYVFSKSTTGLYSAALNNPAWCIPSQCGFNLQSSGGLILATVPEASVLAATVTSLSFATDKVAAGSANAMSAGIGPGGLCWFLVSWKYGGTANWVPGVTSSSAPMSSHASGDAVAGMAFEVPPGLVLSQYQRVQITASVTVANPSSTFVIQGVNEARGLVWVLSPEPGTANYVINLLQPTSVFSGGGPQLGLDEIKRFEIVSPVGGTSDLSVEVTAINFLR